VLIILQSSPRARSTYMRQASRAATGAVTPTATMMMAAAVTPAAAQSDSLPMAKSTQLRLARRVVTDS
jgi:hypothetical protein